VESGEWRVKGEKPGSQLSTLNSQLSTPSLAYLGDAVFELMVREMLVRGGVPFKDIFRRAKTYVSATAQAEMYHKIFPLLAPEEQAIIKRGRNLHSASRAKSANVSEYRHATGLETLFGYLHQTGEFERLQEIFLLATAGGDCGSSLR